MGSSYSYSPPSTSKSYEYYCRDCRYEFIMNVRMPYTRCPKCSATMGVKCVDR